MRDQSDKEKLLKALEEVPMVSIAVKKAGIAKATAYRWKKNKAFAKKFAAAQKRGRETITDLAESHMVARIHKGDMKAVALWLGNNSKRYIKPRGIIKTFSGETQHTLTIDIVGRDGKIAREKKHIQSPEVLDEDQDPKIYPDDLTDDSFVD